MDSLASFLHLLQQVISFEMKRLLKLDGQRPVGCFIDIGNAFVTPTHDSLFKKVPKAVTASPSLDSAILFPTTMSEPVDWC